MNKNYFEIIRAGINSTFQDLGRNNLYHIGVPFSGAMDNRNYLLANKLVGNDHNDPVIEFAYQGPHLKYCGDKLNITITGDVTFKIKEEIVRCLATTANPMSGERDVDTLGTLEIMGQEDFTVAAIATSSGHIKSGDLVEVIS